MNGDVDPRAVREAIAKTKRTHVRRVDPAVLERTFLVARPTPETPMQALMEAGEFEEPAESSLEKEIRLEPVRRAIEEVLTERERWVIEAKFWRGRGLDLTGAELGISGMHVTRITKTALAKLAAYLEEHGYGHGLEADDLG